eukprot:snap_masked-scaffold_36-processed-gene-1.41-mRNA-1 protein AED:0.23 eAED:1.00 QI:0/-1/0/1/-1/1/1/0/380
MTTVSYAVAGALLAFLFATVMIFKVMPQADHIVKKNYGPTEACIFTRCCFMLCALPFYVFTIWMAVVVVFDEQHGTGVISELCADYSCTTSMALGRQQFDKSACTTPFCSTSDVFARQGSQPKSFKRLGLGKELDFENTTKSYSFVDEVLTVSGEGQLTCGNSSMFECMAAFESSLADFSTSFECLSEEGEVCTSFEASVDSAEEFSLFSCSATEDSADCVVLSSPYSYPNTFFAGAMVILFIMPITYITYSTAKTQLSKVFKCNEMTLFIYSQEAGMQSEQRAENLATGGFTNAEGNKHKKRTFGKKDVAILVAGPALVVFFSWMTIVAAGRVGAGFIGGAFALLALHQFYKFRKFKQAQRENLEARVERNNANAAYYA